MDGVRNEISGITVERLNEHFGFALEIDPRAPVGGASASAVKALVDEGGLVLIRGVEFTDDDLASFAGRFGPLQVMNATSPSNGVFRVTNLGEDGRVRAPEEAARQRHEANKLWHTDSSFMTPGASYSFLHARTVPAEDKDTLFCDGRAAWEALDEAEQAQLDRLVAHHSMNHSWRRVGVTLPQFTDLPAIRRKLVRRHGPSGRKALVIPSHVETVDGLDYRAGQALLERLTSIAADPVRVYRHKWKAKDLLIWDNRCMLHRASGAGIENQPRDLRTCRIVDVHDDGLA